MSRASSVGATGPMSSSEPSRSRATVMRSRRLNAPSCRKGCVRPQSPPAWNSSNAVSLREASGAGRA